MAIIAVDARDLRSPRAPREPRLAGRAPRTPGCPDRRLPLPGRRHGPSGARRRAHPGCRLPRLGDRAGDPDDPLPFQLAGPEAFAAAAGRAGIGDGATAVLYDDTASLYASRVWWSLRCYGFDGVRILDGGWPAWLASGRPTSSAAPRIEPSVLTPRGVPRLRLSTSDVRALLGSADVELVDTRAPAEYLGQEGNAKRLGHIPGAINVPSALLTESTARASSSPQTGCPRSSPTPASDVIDASCSTTERASAPRRRPSR